MKHQDLINQMTLEEKASMMSGANFWNTTAIERLNIPSIMLTDGPHGLRKQAGKADHLGLHKSIPATCFPPAATLANSWNKHLVNQMGRLLGKEAASEEVSVILGPGMNIKRNPLCGRNFEYYSEDPYVTGILATEMVKGIQSQGVAASPKHFAVNSQEHMRMTIDEIVDDRALREIYLKAFEMVVKEAKPKTMMTSYNKVNGEFANENQYLVNDILFDEWGFDGVVVTDWGGNNDRVKGLKAHNQLEMPSTNGITDQEIIDAIIKGEIEEAILDEALDQLLELIFETSYDTENYIPIDIDAHHQKAIEFAEQSFVLLKNEDNCLPLNNTESIGVIGDFAKKPRYQGAGSSLINPTKLSSPLDILNQSGLNIQGFAKGFHRMGKHSQRYLEQAATLAEQVDTVLLFVGLDESIEAEGIDRKNLSLHQNQLDLINVVTAMNKNVIVILSGGGVIEMPFINQVKGVIHTYLGGQGMAEAIVNTLTGQANPSGKLTETYPFKYSDLPTAKYYPGMERTAEHRESIFVGYRYFETVDKPVLFPFGYGLSYTTFEYSNIVLKDNSIFVDITNTGQYAGEEVVQLYIEKVDHVNFRAKKELKNFTKVYVPVGQTKTVRFDLVDIDLSFYSIDAKKWEVEKGEYHIHIGASSKDIKETISVDVAGVESREYAQFVYPTYFSGEVSHVPDEEFYRLLGFIPSEVLWNEADLLGMNDTISQARHKHWLGKGTYGAVALVRDGFMKVNNPIWSNNMYFILNMPFRQIERFTGGKINDKMVKKYLEIINKPTKK